MRELSHSTAGVFRLVFVVVFDLNHSGCSWSRNAWFNPVPAAYQDTVSDTAEMEIRHQPRDAGTAYSPRYPEYGFF